MDHDEFVSVAYHESGHAVVAVVFELALDYVTVERTLVDGIYLDGHAKTLKPFNKDTAREYAFFYLAGLFAERKNATGETGFSGDWKQTETEFRHAGYDLPRLEQALTWCPSCEETLPGLAGQIITTCWSVIERIAEQLQIDRTLSAEDIENEIEGFEDVIEEAKTLAGA